MPSSPVQTALTCNGVGVSVHGTRAPVVSCLADGRRHDGPVSFLTDGGWVEVDPWSDWVLEEVRRVR